MQQTLPLTLSKEQAGIIRTVLYFSVFSYPLTMPELFENSAVSVSYAEYSQLVKDLISNNLLKEKDGFIFSTQVSEKDIERRKKGNQGAKDIMPLAWKYSRKIAKFPFVEGLCLSGALSKNYYDEDGDIDFFIITSPNRLWLCRSFLILRYKMLPASKKKYWCTNYFISAEDLSIPDKNMFTATELAFLFPTVNYTAYQAIMGANSWHRKNFPNKAELPGAHCIPASGYFFKSLIETLLGGRLGQWLDNTLLSLTLKHWRKRYHDMREEDFELQFRARKNVSKRHTKGFQNKVLIAWEEKQSDYEKQFQTQLR